MPVLLEKSDSKVAYSGKIPVLNSSEPYFFNAFQNFIEAGYMDSVLKLPYRNFIEILPDNVVQSIRNFNSIDADLSLSITTGTCYSSNIANSIINAIYSRFHLSYSRKDDIRTCLHEAITNAMIHGNMNIKNSSQNFATMLKQQEEINHLLQLDSYRLKYINISVWNNQNSLILAVSDEGDGFEINYNTINHLLTSGRGLMIINAIADSVILGQDKRTVFMTFNH